jgi:hypothetical protein
MKQLPKIVRERLQAGGAVGEHPDPDVLTAFAEQSLAGRERARVLDHVARCRDCRDILAAAIPPLDAEGRTAAGTGSSWAWFRWPALRWGAVAACFVVVGAAAVLLQLNTKHTAVQVREKMEGLARDEKSVSIAAQPAKQEEDRSGPPKQQQRASAARTSAPQPASAPGPTAQPQAVEEKRLMAKESEGAQKKIAPPSGVGERVATGVPPLELQPPANTGRASASLSAHSMDMLHQTTTVPVQSEAMQLEASSTPAAAASSPAASNTLVRQELGKAKASPLPPSAPNPWTTPNTLPSAEGNNLPSQLRAIMTTPRWTISAEGQLERSFDSGKTWEPVVVTDGSTMAVGSTELTGSAASDRYGPALVSEGKKGHQEPSPAGSQPKLQALSANGNDLWVGGAAGALYHSTDAGLHWTRVRPTAGGVMLTADIVALDFSDPQHGKLTSSAGESWVTSDGGKSWQKQ